MTASADELPGDKYPHVGQSGPSSQCGWPAETGHKQSFKKFSQSSHRRKHA